MAFLSSIRRPGLVFAFALAVATLAGKFSPVHAAIEVVPGELTLVGPESAHRVLVLNKQAGEFTGHVNGAIEWTSSHPDVVTVEDGLATPHGNGTAVLTAKVGGEQTQVRVEVRETDRPQLWSFRNHVESVLAKAGCNSGACHGALAGKGGLKLTLQGYDPAIDYHNLTKQSRGRRIELADPGRSLLLAKPSGGLPHKGGVRFDVDSKEYQILAEWIAAGAIGPGDDDTRLVKLSIHPEQSLLQPGAKQQLLVRAEYTDGRIEDVTQWAKFSSTDESVATVRPDGQVSIIGHGEGAVTAWFASRIVIARVTSPYANDVPPAVFAERTRRNFIDELVLAKLQRLDLPPSPPASDAEFLRRAYLDTIGTLPTADEAKTFLSDSSPDKRDQLIESLLSRPEFADYWTYKWSDVLLLNGQLLRPKALKAYYDWIHERVAKDQSWDQTVRELLTAAGTTCESGATNFYALHQDPETLTGDACQAFMGLSIGCARCHNHPLEKWTNNQYYAMANLFARVQGKGWGGEGRRGDGERTVYVAERGDLMQPLTGKPQVPTPLDGEPIPIDDPGDRRIVLAEWMTSPENPYFTRSITNRVWQNFFGVGLVESVDDMRLSNPPSHEELLTRASDFLIEKNYHLKELMRLILQSQTYQTSSQPLPGNKDEKRFYSRYYPRRLMAEVLLDAVSQVTDVPSEFTEIGFPGADLQKTDEYPRGTRAIQLHDSAVVSYFLQAFGRNPRLITCECERSDVPSMVQVLHISNGKTLNGKLQADGNRIDQWLSSGKQPAEIIEAAYLSSLSRYPTEKERTQILSVLADGKNQVVESQPTRPSKSDTQKKESDKKPKSAEEIAQRIVLEDLLWGIMSSREFLFNH